MQAGSLGGGVVIPAGRPVDLRLDLRDASGNSVRPTDDGSTVEWSDRVVRNDREAQKFDFLPAKPVDHPDVAKVALIGGSTPPVDVIVIAA